MATTRKDTKPTKTTRKPGQVMDIAHPSTVRASSTSRPVLITNRPMVAVDPMISTGEQSSGEPASTSAQPKAPINRQARTIQPIGVTSTEEPESAQPSEPKVAEVKAPTLLMPPLPVETANEEAAAANNESATESTPQPIETAPEVPVEAEPTEPTEPETPAEVALEPERRKKISPIHADTAPESDATDSSDSDAKSDANTVVESETDPEEETDSDDTEEDTPSKEKTAEQQRDEQLEAMIAKGTYAVPINRTGKQRVHVLWLLVLVLVLLVVTVNVLLDMGVLTLEGVPHTQFFKTTQ